jgi:outer membrane receptor protein involved in Fe transport
MKICLPLLTSWLLLICLDSNAQDTLYKPLEEVVLTASKLSEKRKEAPVAISTISEATLKKENSNRIDYLLNKVSGVYMPSIGNEQHMMSIRQPISLKGLYLYLEDGMPIRTSGLFSNNGLIEINTGFMQHIEIIKGPASAMYGAEAIGGVINVFSKQTPLKPVLDIGVETNSIGFKKINTSWGNKTKIGGWLINANFGGQQNGPLQYSDYHKNAISAKHQFVINKKLSGYQTLQYINYFAQTSGSVDSIHFAQKDFSSMQTFTYRKMDVFRLKQNIVYQWNSNNSTTLNLLYRDNTMDQNPAYSIGSTANPTKFRGQTNSNQFNSIVMDAQQLMLLPRLNGKLIIGTSIDFTQQQLNAKYIDITKDTSIGKFTSYTYPANDSVLTRYRTKIINQAIYANLISKLNKHFNLNIALRYDAFEYQFQNKLRNGTPSSNNLFHQLTPKIGLTYNHPNWGGYTNYSKGFVPPQITEIYNAIKVPYLLPQSFNNIELGAWFSSKKIAGEIVLYKMMGQNEIISVRQSDGVNLNQNSGSTDHSGIEYKINYTPNNQLSFTWNATHSIHTYLVTTIKGVNVSGNEMNAAPRFWSNLNGELKLSQQLLFSLNWQHQSKYYMDEINKTSYPGFNLINLKFTYTTNKNTIWLHVLNATNTYFATMATKNFSVNGNAAYSYYIGEPRSIVIGFNWSMLGVQ